jgi:hypothetical protein
VIALVASVLNQAVLSGRLRPATVPIYLPWPGMGRDWAVKGVPSALYGVMVILQIETDGLYPTIPVHQIESDAIWG